VVFRTGVLIFDLKTHYATLYIIMRTRNVHYAAVNNWKNLCVKMNKSKVTPNHIEQKPRTFTKYLIVIPVAMPVVGLYLINYFKLSHTIAYTAYKMKLDMLDYINKIDEIQFQNLASLSCVFFYIYSMLRSKHVIMTIMFELFRKYISHSKVQICMNTFEHINMYQSVFTYIIGAGMCELMKKSKFMSKYYGSFIFTLIHHDLFVILFMSMDYLFHF
jgi:hypothetical protein